MVITMDKEPEKNRVSMVINGRMYTIVSAESTEYMQKLAGHINEKVELVRKQGINILGERPIILAALNICDEYYKALMGGRDYSGQLEELNRKMNDIVDENKHLRELLNESQFEIDIQTMQDKFTELMKRNEELVQKLESEQRKSERQLAAMQEEHKRELERVKEDFAKREKELIELAGLK